MPNLYFNSHAHVERDLPGFLISCIFRYFNSHAHVERDDSIYDGTGNLLDFNSHAHVERDSSEQSSFIISSNFNSHAHVERDVGVLLHDVDVTISTHTLTWSVTTRSISFFPKHQFQLTRSRGA